MDDMLAVILLHLINKLLGGNDKVVDTGIRMISCLIKCIDTRLQKIRAVLNEKTFTTKYLRLCLMKG